MKTYQITFFRPKYQGNPHRPRCEGHLRRVTVEAVDEHKALWEFGSIFPHTSVLALKEI